MTWRELVIEHCGKGMSGFTAGFARNGISFWENGTIKRGIHRNSEIIAYNRTPDQMHQIILLLTKDNKKEA